MGIPTDLHILRALLDAGKSRLAASEEKVFKEMLVDLEGGKLVKLSKKQRAWVEKKYYHLQLDQHYKAQAPKFKPVALPKEEEYTWAVNRPLKPPGRT